MCPERSDTTCNRRQSTEDLTDVSVEPRLPRREIQIPLDLFDQSGDILFRRMRALHLIKQRLQTLSNMAHAAVTASSGSSSAWAIARSKSRCTESKSRASDTSLSASVTSGLVVVAVNLYRSPIVDATGNWEDFWGLTRLRIEEIGDSHVLAEVAFRVIAQKPTVTELRASHVELVDDGGEPLHISPHEDPRIEIVAARASLSGIGR
jgi:hypothetical protein